MVQLEQKTKLYLASACFPMSSVYNIENIYNKQCLDTDNVYDVRVEWCCLITAESINNPPNWPKGVKITEVKPA